MATPILNIPELAALQATPYATANAMGRSLEAAANDFLSVDLSAGNVALTAAQYRGYSLFRSSGNTVARDLTLQAIKRMVAIQNAGTAVLTVKRGSAAISLPAGMTGLYHTDGTANGLVALSGDTTRSSSGRRVINFASDANYTMSADAAKDKFISMTDTGVVLTAGRDVVFPDVYGPEYIFANDTAQTLTCKRSGQTGVAVTAGSTVRIYHDGTDMVAAP